MPHAPDINVLWTFDVEHKVDTKQGQGLVYMLGQIGRATEGADLEKRIAELEQRPKGNN